MATPNKPKEFPAHLKNAIDTTRTQIRDCVETLLSVGYSMMDNEHDETFVEDFIRAERRIDHLKRRLWCFETIAMHHGGDQMDLTSIEQSELYIAEGILRDVSVNKIGLQ